MIFHLDRDVNSSDEVLAEMDRFSLRPTVSAETLAFAKAHPDVQQRFNLIGLGSAWLVNGDDIGHTMVLRLSKKNETGRGLYLYWDNAGYSRRFRFLVVGK